MNNLKSFFKPYYFKIFRGSASKFLGGTSDIALPLLLSEILRVATTTLDYNRIIMLSIVLLFIVVFTFGANAYAAYEATKTSENIGNDIRKAFYVHKNKLTISDLKDISYSSLTTRVVYDVESISKFIGIAMRMLVRCVLLAIGGIVVALTIDPYITLVMLATMAIIITISLVIFKFTGKWFKVVSEKIDTTSSIIRQSITGIKTIKSFAKQKHEEDVFQVEVDKIYQAQVVANMATSALSPVVSLISKVSLVAILIISAFRLQSGNIDPISLTTLVVYINLFIQAMVGLSRVMVRYSRADASAKRIHQILSIKPTTKENVEAIKENAFAVEVNNLSFSFDGRKILDDVSFKIQRGTSIAIIGKTGCGKTTLVELLTGIYNDYKGDIYVNGYDVRTTKSEILSKNISIARQNFDIFTDSIEKNIVLDKPFHEGLFERAILNAQVSDFIQTTGKQYDIRQSGTNLSGGQRQRINLARLFYNDPDIFVLDDVSSALDTKTNEKLNKSIEKFDKTVIYISNKVDSVKNLDKIMVLEDGKITGFDNHENLIKTNECYKSLVLLQSVEGGIFDE